MGKLTEKAVNELRAVAAFIDKNAEALVGDMDSTYIDDHGVYVSFKLLEHDSIPTLTISKAHLVWNKQES